MAFLGVGFFAGLTASSPDMLDSLDSYTDNNNMYDIKYNINTWTNRCRHNSNKKYRRS